MGGSRPEREEEEVYVKQEEGVEGEEEEEVDPMAAMMGFGGFGTTKVSLPSRSKPKTDIKNKSTGQYEGATANVHTQRTWRQYMNRRGGFNRALDKVTK
jgi:U4/U6.U5 tri-snRNP-associated protein 3